MLTLNDRLLLALDPSAFADAATIGTPLASGADGAIAGTVLTSASSDFAARGVDDGHVIVVAGKPLDVDDRTGATTLDVSRPRKSKSEPKIAPDAGTGLAFQVVTFDRQIDRSRSRIMRALGIYPDHPEQPLVEDDIINASEIEQVIAAETLAEIYAAAAAGDPTSDSLAQRAVLWAGRAHQLAQSTPALIDLDDDGLADATRFASVATLRRL
jgi:hypothetical protein